MKVEIMKKTKAIYLVAVLAVSALLLTAVNAQTVLEEARRHMARGQAAVEMAKSPADLEDAVMEFQKAIELAPDWPDAYYQLGVLQDKLGKYDDAWNNLKRCLQLAPQASNAGQIQELIYKIEYKRDKVNHKKAIINALTGGTIQRKGNSGGGACAVKNFIQVGEDIKANIWCLVSAYNQTVPVEFDGSVLKFKYTYYGCPQAPLLKQFPCPWEVSVVGEVIATSPLRLKVKENWENKFGGDYKPSYELEWEFSQ
jgi:hypothetical protein